MTEETNIRSVSLPIVATDAGFAAANSQAVCDVVEHRAHQVDRHGFTPEHDAEHTPRDLLNASDAYLEATRFQLADGWSAEQAAEECEFLWPFADGFKVKDPRANLVKAAALLLAAIDRLDATAPDAPLVDGEPA